MEILEFTTREEASRAAAERLASALGRRLEAQDEASIVVSGGTTPADCLKALSHAELDWSNVHIVLSDERWVPPTSDDSNERMVGETLLVNGASTAQLLPMFADDTTVDDRAVELDNAIRSLPFPFAATLLGMGADGHFASLFPDADDLDTGLDPDANKLATAVRTASSPHPRLSLTMAALSRADEVLLLVFGDEKRRTLESAMESDELPIARLLRQKRAPVSVYWAP
jgi:6-phosphogluconolactonase